MKWPWRVPPYWVGMLVAVFLILIGIAGIFLPFLQGLLLIGLGLLLIMEYHYIPAFERRREWFKKKYDTWKKKVQKKVR